MTRIFLALPLLSLVGCATSGGVACTEIGCTSELVLTVTGPADTSTVTGTVTVGGQEVAVDCAAGSAEVTCDGNTIVVTLPQDVGGGDVTWSLVDGGPYQGSGTVTPTWESSTPNGEECPPTCWAGVATVDLVDVASGSI